MQKLYCQKDVLTFLLWTENPQSSDNSVTYTTEAAILPMNKLIILQCMKSRRIIIITEKLASTHNEALC